jgi:hypothetical protein
MSCRCHDAELPVSAEPLMECFLSRPPSLHSRIVIADLRGGRMTSPRCSLVWYDGGGCISRPFSRPSKTEAVRHLGPPPLARALALEFVQLCGQGRLLLLADTVSNGIEDLEMLLLQVLKSRIEFLVPGVQDEDLEAQCRTGDDKVGDGDGPCDNHGVEETTVQLSVAVFVLLKLAQQLSNTWELVVWTGSPGIR